MFLTVNALPVSLRLAVEQGVLVLGQHLRLGRHVRLPHLQGLDGQALLLERRINRRDDAVHGLQALSLTELLRARQTPWDLPARWLSGGRLRLADAAVAIASSLPQKTPIEGTCASKRPKHAWLDVAWATRRSASYVAIVSDPRVVPTYTCQLADFGVAPPAALT